MVSLLFFSLSIINLKQMPGVGVASYHDNHKNALFYSNLLFDVVCFLRVLLLLGLPLHHHYITLNVQTEHTQYLRMRSRLLCNFLFFSRRPFSLGKGSAEPATASLSAFSSSSISVRMTIGSFILSTASRTMLRCFLFCRARDREGVALITMPHFLQFFSSLFLPCGE